MSLFDPNMFVIGAPTLGADGKDYRANFGHALFPNKSAR
jgi:hypothetical protein